MSYATTFRHSATEPVRGREVDVNFDGVGTYVDATFLPLAGGTVTGTIVLTATTPFSGTWDGWIGANETWTYASATTFTITGDLTGKYAVGDKLKLTQTTVKYFYVTAVSYSAPNTTVTVTGGSDYSVANAAISSNFYSHSASPVAFPQWFAYTTSWTGTGSAPDIGNGTLAARFSIVGRNCTMCVEMTAGNTTTFGTGAWGFTSPVASANKTVYYVGSIHILDSGTADFFAFCYLPPNGSTVFMGRDNTAGGITNAAPMAWTTNDRLELTLQYELP